MPALYEQVGINDLTPGPRRVSFTGQVVNIYDQNVESKMPKAAKGCLKLLVKDASAVILVKLWYAEPYEFCLGRLVTISTTHLSSTSWIGNGTRPSTTPASILTSIFPERDIGCKIEEGGDAVCRTSPRNPSGQNILGLVTLEAFMGNGADEVPGVKILVCTMNVTQPRTFTSKSNMPMTVVSVGVCDQSCRASLTLYLPLISSAQDWQPFKTILLISCAKCLPGGTITTTARTQIEVDPQMTEAASLRRWVQREYCRVNEGFPIDLFDTETVENNPIRLQFTLATLHSFIDASPTQAYSGYLSVILAELHLVSLYTKQQIFSMECCGMPIYGNTARGNCHQCSKERILRINPNLVGEIADETGAIYNRIASTSTANNAQRYHSNGKNNKILWSDKAWATLLGKEPEAFAEWIGWVGESSGQLRLLQALEHRLSYMRVVMMIGWTGEWGGGRLAILKIVQ